MMGSIGSDTRKALLLCLLAAANYFLFYGLGVFLARTLGMEGFGLYNVAVASFAMLASFSTLGLEKFALRTFSGLVEQNRWDKARGFSRFSLRIIFMVSAVAALVFSAGNWWDYVAFRTTPWTSVALLVTVVTSMGLAMFLIEMLSAAGDVTRVTIIYRLLLPVSTLVLVGAVYLLSDGLTAGRAVICYGAAWVISLLAILQRGRRTLPPEFWMADDKYESRQWLRGALPFFLQSFMMTQFASSGVVVLKMLDTSNFEISLYAAAIQVASFAVLLATSTSRFYAPKVAVLLDRQDWDSVMRLKRERDAWMNPTVLIFLILILLFGSRVMALYGPGFERGYTALIILAVGVAVSVKFAMAPYALQFIGKSRWVLGAISVAGILNLVLLAILGGAFGAIGAAIAYSTSLIVMSVSMCLMSMYWIRDRNCDGEPGC